MISLKCTFISAFALGLVVLATAGPASAQLRLPQASQRASVMQTVGVTDVTIVYARPGVKGRKIWGAPPADISVKGEATLDNLNPRPAGMPLVAYGHIWRTGANAATQFTVTDDVLINGKPLPAGHYSLHSIPAENEWTLIFNSVANQPGSVNYDSSKDVLRVAAKPEWVADNKEWLSFTINPISENSAQVALRWERIRVPFTVEVKDLAAMTIAKARTAVAAAQSDDWQTPFNAANYAKNNNSAGDAAKWYEQSLKAIDEQIKAKSSYENLARRSTILLGAGRTQEALAAAEKAVEQGTAEKADTSAMTRRIAELKAAEK